MKMKQLRERVNLRTADVASKIGVADSSVRNWEAGRTIPRLRADQMGLLCKLYKVSIEDLVKSINETAEGASHHD